MKKLHLKQTMLLIAVLCCVSVYAQKSPASLQKRLTVKQGEKLPAFKPVLLPTLKTTANPPAAGATDGVDVRVFPSVNVQAEVTIEVNKANPLNLLASANTLTGPFAYNQGHYASLDGGVTWTGADVLQNIDPTKIDGDPSVSFSADGTAFLTTIAAGAFGTKGYWFQKSADGGITWSVGVKGDQTSNYDKGMNTADNIAASPFANNFYCTWTNFNSGGGAVELNRSTDKGTTFLPKIQLRSGAVGFGQGNNVQTGPNGEVYVCWADHQTVISPFAADGMGFAKSLDGGATFTPASVIFPYTGTRVDNTSSTYNFTRVNDFPSMAVDKSTTAKRGRIYITYPEKNASGHSEIKVRFSSDGGTTWSAGKVVNIPTARESFFPWITVDDATGIVWVVYYAFDQATGYATNTYVAGSVTGLKWVNLKVSDVSHITAPIDNTNFAAGYAGDYIGIAANGLKAYPTWMDNRNGQWQVYCSPVTVTTSFANGVAEIAAITPANKLTVNPNPFTSAIHIALTGTTAVSAQLYTQSGKLIKQWQNAGENLSVSEVRPGFYVIKVLGKDGKYYTQNLIKK